MGFQAIVFAGQLGASVAALTSAEQPSPLLPVATHPLVSFSLEWVAAAGLTDVILVAGAPRKLWPCAPVHQRGRARGRLPCCEGARC